MGPQVLKVWASNLSSLPSFKVAFAFPDFEIDRRLRVFKRFASDMVITGDKAARGQQSESLRNLFSSSDQALMECLWVFSEIALLHAGIPFPCWAILEWMVQLEAPPTSIERVERRLIHLGHSEIEGSWDASNSQGFVGST